jgi:tRNA A-37 threonylcarbamoyl transferase component Bud32
MVEWKIMREDFVEVIGEPFVKSIENQFNKKGLELRPNQLIPLLYKQKKLTEEEYELLKECYEGYSEEEQALTIQKPIPNTLVEDEEIDGTLDLAVRVEEAIKESSAEIDLFAGFEEEDAEEEIQKPSTRLQRFKFDETRYQKLGPIGKGGMGIVEKYLDLRLNKEVAVKKIYSKKVTKEQERRFQREKDMTALFDDPKIIRALDVGYDNNNNLCFVMEYVRGQEFSKRIERAGKGKSNSLPELLDILAKSLDALGGVHKKKVVHRDIKPDNIMIDEFNIKIMDFGLAKKIKGKELKREDGYKT